MSATPFTVHVPDSELADLRARLARRRLAPDFANADWRYGASGDYLEGLLRYWEQDYDWRRAEAAINALPNFKTTIEGVPIHFLHVKGKGPKPLPLILSHGWPWTFWDWHKVIGPLSDPAAHGGDSADAFDVVVPSLPGYGFSSPLTTTGINFWRTADLWVKLMREVLGYARFAAGGGDWGAILTAQLGHKYAEHLIGCYLHLMVPLDVFNAPFPGAEVFQPEEQAMQRRNENFFARETGYSALQATKPQSLAHALNDSPTGLAAWITEKRRTWSDCGGDVERRFSKDDLCTTLTIYWATQTFGTSARYYYECVNNPWRPSHDRSPVVEAPTGVGVFPNEVVLLPRRWAEQYYNLQHWTEMQSGGHFAPMEEPAALVDDIRKFYRGLR
ncbi:MAG: epoxide hydrolase [Gammaproteobacteria bacterium]|jgi:pimeloyl-ACP methyl ester carboxylesterase|nr:epoxide hydrolase [Gammaproteobacteria bacterium]